MVEPVRNHYPLGHFDFNYKDPLVFKTIFTQLMLEEGFLSTTAFYASFAHNDNHVEKYLRAIDKTFSFISKALRQGRLKEYLKGPASLSFGV